MTAPSGTVYLVGAGPGDRAYLTLQAQDILAQADAVVYDALVDERLFDLLPPGCQRIEVGKRGGQPSTAQDDINRLLVRLCQQGQRVVRLKSGDPFIFGRSAAEIDALHQAGCDVVVIPGLSSALTAPLLAGIPLTDPVLSRCFAVLSAHDLEELNWDALTQIETLVILMGTRHLADIIDRLQQHGQSSKTPIAIIRWAGHPDQHIWTGTLETILQQTARQDLSPAVIVIGEVVGLRPYLQTPPPSDKRDQSPAAHPALHPTPSQVAPLRPALAGKTVLVTRSASQSSEFSDRLGQEGATVIEMPALEIGPPSSWDALDQAIAQLETFDWLILTSSNGVNAFFERLAVQNKDARDLHGLKIAVVGQKTAQGVQQHGLRPDFIPPDFVADSLIEHFPDLAQLSRSRILFPRVESGGRDALIKDFTDRGAHVVEVAAYESRCPQTIPPEALNALRDRTLDIVTFASSKTVSFFCQLLNTHPALTAAGASPASWLEGVCIASIGPQTSTACQKWLGRVDVEAQEYTLEGLTQAIAQWANRLHPPQP